MRSHCRCIVRLTEDVDILVAIRINDEFTIDVMNSASGFTWAELVPFRTRVDGIQVLSLEGLLKMKENGRLKDRADAEAIRRALGVE